MKGTNDRLKLYRWFTMKKFVRNAAFFFISFCFLLMFSVSSLSGVIEGALSYVKEEDSKPSHAKAEKVVAVEDPAKEMAEDDEILKFQPNEDVVIPANHPVKLIGLSSLPDNFANDTSVKRQPFKFRMLPYRLTGANGLLATREFQGNTWSDTFMKGAVVFFVHSFANHKRRRSLMRSTWGSIREIDGLRIEIVFVTGHPMDFKLQADLLSENVKNGDILQYDGADDESASTLKLLASLQWSADTLPSDFYYAFATDDALVNIAVVREHLFNQAPPISVLPGRVNVMTSSDGFTVTSSIPQVIHCFENYVKSEKTERHLDLGRSVDKITYNADKWPPYCTEGLYVLPVSVGKQLYKISRSTSLSFPYDLHDIFVTGILRRKMKMGDENIREARNDAVTMVALKRFHFLPRSSTKRLAQYKQEAEETFRSTWRSWYKNIQYRFHIQTISAT